MKTYVDERGVTWSSPPSAYHQRRVKQFEALKGKHFTRFYPAQLTDEQALRFPMVAGRRYFRALRATSDLHTAYTEAVRYTNALMVKVKAKARARARAHA